MGHTMTKGIERIMNNVRRAVERGQGPADQSLPIDIKVVVTLTLGCDPLVPGGMVCPREAATMGTFFLTREIELTAANVADVQWGLEARRVVWLLHASKTDTSGKGVRRSWGCVCAGVSSKTPCPFCSSLQVREFHLQRGPHVGSSIILYL